MADQAKWYAAQMRRAFIGPISMYDEGELSPIYTRFWLSRGARIAFRPRTDGRFDVSIANQGEAIAERTWAVKYLNAERKDGQLVTW